MRLAMVPASEKEAETWSAADKFTVVLETAGLNATELGGTCRERGLSPEQVDRWRKADQDANAGLRSLSLSPGPENVYAWPRLYTSD